MRFRFVPLLAAVQVLAAAPAFTDRLWAEIAPIYAKTLEHPFLKGLADGSLPEAKFQFYLVQDSHYLRGFAQALHTLASKAPREEWSVTLSRHAVDALAVERQLHASLIRDAGRAANASPAPSNYAYMTHLLATTHRGSFAEGLAAVLPCYKVYFEVGKELKKAGSKNASYRKWIDQYADPAYGKTVQEVLDIMNAEAAGMTERERQRAVSAFTLSARYEYLFWDAAWKEERWLP